MVTSRGKSEVTAYIADTPKKLASLMRGAARAGAAVVMDEAKERVESDAVRDGLTSKVKSAADRVVATIFVKPGWAGSVGTWLEYGTSPHLISVDASQRAGRSVNRINRLAKQPDSNHSLVIGGQFVGATVMHPGARPHPFLRVSLDVKEAEAIAAAQNYIDSRVSPGGVIGGDEPESEGA